MAGPLAAMERFFERIFERPAARLLAPRLEPIHLQRHLERAMEGARIRRDGRWHVPSRFLLLLHSSDLVALSGRQALPVELAEMMRDHARRRGYVLDARPTVKLEASPRVAPGDVVVLADELAVRADPPAQAPLEGRQGGAIDSDPGHGATSLFAAAQPAVPQATIVVRAPGHEPVRISVEAGRLRVGRSEDNDIVVPDQRVSRHHGEITVRLGTLVYRDLGSTNGSFLQGSRVHEMALGPDDVIQLGSSTLTVESAAR